MEEYGFVEECGFKIGEFCINLLLITEAVDVVFSIDDACSIKKYRILGEVSELY